MPHKWIDLGSNVSYHEHSSLARKRQIRVCILELRINGIKFVLDRNELSRKSNEKWAIGSQLFNILDAFSLLAGKISIQNSQLVQNHLGRPPDKDSFIGHLGQLAALMTEFASAQLVFSSLDREDQNILLKSNVPLYLQYIVARYFSAATGVEQLSWILEGQLNIESIEVVRKLHRISLAEFDLSVQMFASKEAAKVFAHHVDNIGAKYPFPQHCSGLVANMLLYVTDESNISCLKESRRIQCIFEHAKELVKTGLNSLDRTLDADVIANIGPLIQTLKEMKLIFGTCQFSANRYISSYTLDVAYTDTEELWLKRQFRRFAYEYTVPLPPKEYFQQLVELLQTGKPTGESFVVSWMGFMTERVWRVLKMHPEFRSLSQREQVALWSNNYKAAVGLGSAQANSMKTGKDQLRVILGHLGPDDDSWEDRYKEIDLDRLTGSYLNDPEINHGRLDESGIRCFFDVLKEISQIVSNDQLFQLCVLLTILDSEGLDGVGPFTDIVRIRQIYLKLFQRKLKASGCSFLDYASFRRTLTKVRTYATLLENFSSS